MAQVVFVLGAGASAEAGAPLMANFLDVAEDIWLSGKAQMDSGHFERVFKSIAALKSVHAQLTLDTYNLETVFSAFEMGAMVGRLGSLTDVDEIDATRSAMVRLIARTLQDTVRMPYMERRVYPPRPYADFVEFLRRAPRTASPRGLPAVITLNYDLGIDHALFFLQMPHAYGVVGDLPPNAVPLLKLHGSLNWGTCQQCGELVPWDLPKYFQTHQWNILPPFDDEPAPTLTLAMADQLHELRHCNASLPDVPVVVPPTWNKSDNKLLRNVWRHAAIELAGARYIVFIGYSFPKTDLYFQYLLALGLAGETRIRRIVVINPDRNAVDRLNEMLTPTLRARVEFRPMPFSGGLSVLPDLLDVEKDR